MHALVTECPSCRASLPPDSNFCPMCGYVAGSDANGAAATEVMPADSLPASPAADTVPAGMPASPARMPASPAGMPASPGTPAPGSLFAAPAPATSDPVPAAGAPRRHTAPIPVVAVDSEAQGAQAQPHGQARGLPGMPTFIPITPRPRLIILGVLFIVIGVWALLSFLPGNKPAPVDPQSPGRAPVGQLTDEYYYAGNVIAFALILIGGTVAVTAALHRAQQEVLCRNCHRQVIGWKDSFGLLCPLDKHYARIDWVVLVATIGFWAISAILLLVLAIIVIF